MTRLEQITYLKEVKNHLLSNREKVEEHVKKQELAKVKVLRYKPKKRS